MARTMDAENHERRKVEIAAAVWGLVARSGLESVSMRAVAGEAGVSIGQVQYYFSSKDALLMYGLERAQMRMEWRIKERLRKLRDDVGAAEILRAAVEEVVGGHPDTLEALRVSVAYLPRARSDNRVREVLFGDDRELRELAEIAVRESQVEKGRDSERDAGQEARIIWALANNLGSEVAFGQITPEDALVTINYHLDRVLGV